MGTAWLNPSWSQKRAGDTSLHFHIVGLETLHQKLKEETKTVGSLVVNETHNLSWLRLS